MHIDLPEKRYYGIGEVARAFDVNTSLIRFWEKEFDMIQPKKNAKGNRKFTPQDIKSLQLIYHLVKERGFTLEGACLRFALPTMSSGSRHSPILRSFRNSKR